MSKPEQPQQPIISIFSGWVLNPLRKACGETPLDEKEVNKFFFTKGEVNRRFIDDVKKIVGKDSNATELQFSTYYKDDYLYGINVSYKKSENSPTIISYNYHFSKNNNMTRSIFTEFVTELAEWANLEISSDDNETIKFGFQKKPEPVLSPKARITREIEEKEKIASSKIAKLEDEKEELLSILKDTEEAKSGIDNEQDEIFQNACKIIQDVKECIEKKDIEIKKVNDELSNIDSEKDNIENKVAVARLENIEERLKKMKNQTAWSNGSR